MYEVQQRRASPERNARTAPGTESQLYSPERGLKTPYRPQGYY